MITGVAAFGALVALPASAQSSSPSGPSAATSSPERLLEEWRSEHGPNWRMHTNASTGMLEMLYGGSKASPFEPDTNQPEEWFQIARYWLEESYSMHGVEQNELVESRFRYLPLGQVNTTDKVTVRFEQVVGDVPVEDGAVNVLFDTRGRLLSIHTTASPAVETPSGNATTGAGFARLVAARAFQNEFGVQPTSSETLRLVHAWVNDGETRRWTLAWEVDATFQADDEQPIGRLYTIDANGRDVLKSENTVHNFDVFGTVRSNATPGLTADRAANPPVPIEMPRVRITSSAGTVETDRDGNFNIVGVNTPIDLTVTYFGQFTNVNNDAGADHTITFQNVQPNQQNDLLMNPNPTQFITAEANAQLHINVLRDWIVDRFPGDTTADFRATANVNQSSNCNAFFNGGSVNFFTAGGGCNNTCFSTVVAHEMGHWLNVLYGTGNGSDGMGEGNADVFAMYLYDDPVVGRFFTTGGGFVRTGNNTRQFCGDSNPGCHGGVHANGEVWMGAAWKARQNLNASLGGAAGDLQADLLFLGWMNGFNQTQIRTIMETQWLTLDDDDGNINNGTPNYTEIDGGFRAQGFPGFDLEFVELTNVTELADTIDEAGPYVVDATAQTLLGTTLGGVEILYRSGPGAFLSVPMANVGGNDFQGGIPGQISPITVEYYVRGFDTSGNESFFPEDGAEDPLTFRVGDITPILVTDFESGPDGFVGGVPGDTATTGEWTIGNPRGTAAQPENDNSNPGTNCWFTGQGPPGGGLGDNDVDGGFTTLVSPIFDAAGIDSVELTYYRWYSNNTGGNPNADIFEVEVSVDGGASWVDVETVGPGGNQSNGGWFRASFDLATIVTPSSQMQIRFVASDLGGGSIVEAAIDDIEIVGVESSVPPPVRYCTTNPNSTGQAARIDISGSTRISNNDLLLLTSGMPNSSFGYYFFGDQQTQTPLSGSMGILCATGTGVFRLPPVQSDSLFGQAFYAVDYTDGSTGAVNITAGSTWNFQMWFRDSVGGAATSNTTDALQLSFGD
ncbi:MAG: hypothetical protein AAF957_17505 [Planctomycetota bacterium]